MICVTPARRSDYCGLGQLMYHTIQRGAFAYSVPERHAWCPKAPRGKRWNRRLDQMQVFVARSPGGLLGFVAIRDDGYIDFAYVRVSAQRRGVFRALMKAVCAECPNLTLSTHASLHAQPAFAAMGFSVVAHEFVRRSGQRLRRAYMSCP